MRELLRGCVLSMCLLGCANAGPDDALTGPRLTTSSLTRESRQTDAERAATPAKSRARPEQSCGACRPGKLYSIDGIFMDAHALVLCDHDSYNLEIHDPNPLAIVPRGGTHTLYLRLTQEHRFPRTFPEDAVTVFAGSCPMDPPEAFCLAERSVAGAPIAANRIEPTISLVSPRLAAVTYRVPDAPRQVVVNIDFCSLFPSDVTCGVSDDSPIVSRLGYTFRYETVEHITLATQEPGAECACLQ
jgi:hypothetical protein